MRSLRLVSLLTCLHFLFEPSSINTVFATPVSIKPATVTLACVEDDFYVSGYFYRENGWVVLIYILLWFLLFYAAAVIIERSLAYRSVRKSSRIFSQRAALALSANQIQEAIKISKDYAESPLAEAMADVFQVKQCASKKDFDAEAFQVSARSYAAATCDQVLNKNFEGLKKAGKIALISGTGGAIIGLIDALQQLRFREYYENFFSFFALRISESFEVFFFSLVIAALCLWFHKQFFEKAKSLTGEFETESWQLINRLAGLPQNRLKSARKIEKSPAVIEGNRGNQPIECNLFSGFIRQ